MATNLTAIEEAILNADDVNRGLGALGRLLYADPNLRGIGDLIDIIHISMARHLAEAQFALKRLEKQQ